MKSNFDTSSRRSFIKGACAGWLILQSPLSIAANASVNKTPLTQNKKLVWIFLRGALDSLHTVLPLSDPNFLAYRQHLIDPIKNDLLKLDNNFALHPNLKFMHELYRNKQMSPVVAVASGYRQRSHFDAQDQMESGLNLTEHESGWLARASNQVLSSGQSANSVAISRSVPISLRGSSKQADTWFPSSFPEADDDLLERLGMLYENDPMLSKHLHAVMTQKQNPNMQMQEKRRANFTYLAERCGELLANNNTQFAMLEMGGWDTHNSQLGRLAKLFTELDNGIKKLRIALGDSWDDTLVVVSTEFGRTVAMNGTAGTDHGTGANMFFAGGALKTSANTTASQQPLLEGGKVYGKWPGLAPAQLFEERDLMPTSDIRNWYAKAITHQWNLSSTQVKKVFPDIIA